MPVRRRVSNGELFTSDELENGEVILEEVEPSEPIPEEEQVEPWAEGGKALLPRVRERVSAYREFLAQWRADHPGEGEDDYGS
jgi:hypothetical protein